MEICFTKNEQCHSTLHFTCAGMYVMLYKGGTVLVPVSYHG